MRHNSFNSFTTIGFEQIRINHHLRCHIPLHEFLKLLCHAKWKFQLRRCHNKQRSSLFLQHNNSLHINSNSTPIHDLHNQITKRNNIIIIIIIIFIIIILIIIKKKK